MGSPQNDWPTGRGRPSALVAQFGADRAELLRWALTTGDPLADAVVAEIAELGRDVRVMLADGIRDGLASLVDPTPGVKALLTQTETVPDYVDDELLDRGSWPHFVPPSYIHNISLSAGALVRVYDSPSIATVLAATGRLIESAPRRLEETGKWINTALLPGAMRVGAPGYASTLQVRLLHAQIRRLVGDREYDKAGYGVPINQIDLARTWMDFTLTSYAAEEKMGYDKTSAELESLYRYWWYIAHVLGVDSRLVEGITDNESARRVDDMLQAVTGPPIEESGALAVAALRNSATALNTYMHVPMGLAKQAMYGLTRRFQGDALCDELGLPKATAVQPILSLVIGRARARHRKISADPEARRRARDEGIAISRELSQMDQTAAYQHETEETS